MNVKPFLHAVKAHIFVASVSVAAFSHSSWSLATVFGGHEPSFSWAWVGWIIPAALIAGSIDIGLLSLAAQIENPDERTKGRVVSFALLALGMFALQGLYVSAHIPVIELGPGVRPEWVSAAQVFRDSMLIVAPGLLPLALILHTISGAGTKTVTPPVGSELSDKIGQLARPEPTAALVPVQDDPMEKWVAEIGLEVPHIDDPLERSNGHRDGAPIADEN